MRVLMIFLLFIIQGCVYFEKIDYNLYINNLSNDTICAISESSFPRDSMFGPPVLKIAPGWNSEIRNSRLNWKHRFEKSTAGVI